MHFILSEQLESHSTKKQQQKKLLHSSFVMLFQAFTTASFSFGGLLPSVSSSAGKRHALQGLSVEIDLASLKPSTSCPDELLCCYVAIGYVAMLEIFLF